LFAVSVRPDRARGALLGGSQIAVSFFSAAPSSVTAKIGSLRYPQDAVILHLQHPLITAMWRYHRVRHSYLADGLADRARPLPVQDQGSPRESLRGDRSRHQAEARRCQRSPSPPASSRWIPASTTASRN